MMNIGLEDILLLVYISLVCWLSVHIWDWIFAGLEVWRISHI